MAIRIPGCKFSRDLVVEDGDDRDFTEGGVAAIVIGTAVAEVTPRSARKLISALEMIIANSSE